MVFNFIDKNNVGSTIKNNGSTQTKKQPVIGTLFSCVKEAVPETAPAYYFYYVREENKLYAGQGSNKPLKEINTGSGTSSQVPGTSVDLSDYATNDSVTAEINAVKALIPDIKEYMKTTDVRAALNLKADTDNVYDKETVNRLINEIKSGTVDMDLYVKKEDADRLYAAVDHVHDDVYTKTQTDSQISAAIAQAELNGGSGEGVDLSGFLKTTDAENIYLKKTDALTSDTVQSMIDGAGHLTSADISGFITKETADATYQQIGDYTDRDTVQSMIDNAGHLTAADVATMQADINAAKADASAAKTAAEQAAQNAQDAKTKAESVETIANDAKTKAEAAETKADAAKTIAETAKTTAEAAQSTADTAKSTAEAAQSSIDNINTYLASDEFKVILEKQMQDIFASSVENPDEDNGGSGGEENPGSGESGSGQGSGSGSSAGGSSTGGSTGTVTPGTKTTFSVQAQNNGSIDLSSLGVKFTEDQILNNKIHFYVMPDSTAIGSYVQTNHPEGLEIPISFDGETEETVAYDKIWSDNSLENPGYIVSFDSSDGDDSNGFDVLEMSSYTISAGWTLGILIDA